MEDHTRYVQQFEEAEEQASRGSRAEAEKARSYFDGDQFSAEELAALRARKQPITPENLIKGKVEALCGLERQTRTDPQAWPRTQQHDEDAQAATDALRYVSDDQDIDIKKSRVFANMLVEGFGGVEIGVHRSKGQIDPLVTLIAHRRLYRDPHAAEPDFSDGTFSGYVTWMDAAKAKRKWKGKEKVIEATINRNTSSSFDGYDDKPSWATWYDGKRKRIRINTHYHLEGGVWHRCVFTLAGELEESKPVEFLDEDGNPENPLILQAAYMDADNDAYGIVRDMIPLQDGVNKRISKLTHILNNRAARVSQSVGQDAEKVRKELARPDGVLVGEAGEVEILPFGDISMGQFQLLNDHRTALKGNIGPSAYLAGKEGQQQSGRAVMAMQQASMTEMTPLLDNLRHFTLRMYRQIWNRIRQYWTAERWVRVTDEEKNVRFVGLNITAGHMAMQKLAEAVKAGEVDEMTARQYEQQIMMDPAMQQPVNQVAELDVDIEIDEVAETPSLQIEQFEQLNQLVGNSPLGGDLRAWKLIIKASNLRDKQELLDMVDEMLKSQQQPDPMAQQAQEIQMRGMVAGVEKVEAEVEETVANTMLIASKAETEQVKPLIEGLKAGSQPGAPM